MTNIKGSVVDFFKENRRYIPVWLVKSLILFLFLYYQLIDFLGEFSALYIGLIFVLGILGLIIDVALTVGLLFLLAALPPRRVTEYRERSLRLLIPDVIIIGTMTALMFGILFLSFPIRDRIETVHIHNDISQSEAVFEYSLSEYHLDGIKDIDTQHELIIIDYDKHTVSFLTFAGYEQYAKLQLTKADTPPDGLLQCDIPLPAPGARMVTYRPDEENWGTTCSIALYMEDGSVYAMEDIPQKDEECNGYYGLNPTEAPRLADKDNFSVIWSH